MNNLIRKLVPQRIKQFLRNQKLISYINNGSAQITYSQQGEDLAIDRLFPKLNKGFYVDIGAFHPMQYSNTFKLYQRGWSGINIEPNPDHIKYFKTYRNRDVNLNIGVSKTDCIMKYYSFNGSAVNTFIEAKAMKWSKVKGFKLKAVKEIHTKPLADILTTYIRAGQNIDLMNVDVEGMDIEVLQSNNWVRFRPNVILIEDLWNEKASLQDSEIYQFLYSKNYSLWNIVGITMFFTDDTLSLIPGSDWHK